MARIYISSTYNDLQDERRSVADAIMMMGHFPVGMEHYSASEQRPLDKCLADVRSCQGYVGLFAWRYGYILSSHHKSITQLEYEEAAKHNLPRLIFLLSEEAPWPASRIDKDQQKIRTLRQYLETQHIVKYFSSAAQLAAQVTAAISNEFRRGHDLPSLLPHLVDRSEQEFKLSEALQRFNTAAPYPFVCLIHGNEFQSHDMFLERLKEDVLPRLLNLNREQAAIMEYSLHWPSRFGDADELHRKLQMGLAKTLLNRSFA